MKTNHTRQSVELGEHIVADPKVCHGKPVFKGTRIMVFQVLDCLTPNGSRPSESRRTN